MVLELTEFSFMGNALKPRIIKIRYMVVSDKFWLSVCVCTFLPGSRNLKL